MIAKSIAIKRRGGRSGGCVVKAVKLTSGDLCRCPGNGTEEAVRLVERGTEVSRGRIRPVVLAEGPNGAREGLKGKASKT